MQTIVTTRYYGPTNTRGSRIKVSTRRGSRFIPFEYAASWNGVSVDTLKSVVSALMSDDTVTVHVTDAEIVSGPQDTELKYWIVSFEHEWNED